MSDFDQEGEINMTMAVSQSLLDFELTAEAAAAAGVQFAAATIPVGGAPYWAAVTPNGASSM